MRYDLVIRGGTVIDGTGGPARQADVGIVGDKVVEIGECAGDATETVDATGRLVTPGFVDIHTHLDAQMAWDPVGTVSCWHGVTTAVMGNCGVTFAPCKPEDRETLARMMESVEDIPADAILSGLPWDWETYTEYLDSYARIPMGINLGGMVGHCSVRIAAMGDRAIDQHHADATDIVKMCELVEEALVGGALGFSTSRTYLHLTPDGREVPGTWAAPEELLAIGEVMGRLGRGVFECAVDNDRQLHGLVGQKDRTVMEREVAWMKELSIRTGRPVTFGFVQNRSDPDGWRYWLELVAEANAAGADIRPQTTTRGIGVLFGLANRTPFDNCSAAWRALRNLSATDKLAKLSDPAFKAQLVADVARTPSKLDLSGIYRLDASRVSYEADPSESLAAHAERRGVSPAQAFLDMAIETGTKGLWNYPFLNWDFDAIEEKINDPSVILGIGDAGAHCGQIQDASQSTYFLTRWVRDAKKWTVEEAVSMLAADGADLFAFEGRGRLVEGNYADVNVIDLDNLELCAPEYVYDFPNGAGRWIQKAKGYDLTLVNGQVFMRDGEHQGALAGRIIRA
ncbi:MAG: N-acyl-D-amino-acid deacylase family protein [Acidimicrobiales bacterium]